MVSDMRVTQREVSSPFLKDNLVKDKQATLKAPENTDKASFGRQGIKTEEQFIEAQKAQILNEVKAPTDVNKLNDLKNQLQTGAYDINPADIARKMILS